MKVNPRKKKRAMKSKLTLDLESASIVRLRRMKHTPTEGLVSWNSETRIGENRIIGLSNASADPEVDNKKTSRQRIKARISTSSKLPGIDRVTPPLVTPLVENGASIEEALNKIVGSIGEQNEQMYLRMSELERAVHVERESLREEINRDRQEVGRSEKR